MEVRWLETFAVVAHSPSLSAAATRLGYAPSTVTLHIKRLEKALGVMLLERYRPGLPLTAAGAVLLQHAETIIATLAVARTEISEIKRRRGQVGEMTSPFRFG